MLGTTKKNRLLSYTLALSLMFIFLNNHSALFVSEYLVLLAASLALSLVYILRNLSKCTLNFYNTSAFLLLTIMIFVTMFFQKTIMDRGTLLSYILWLLFYMIISSFTLTSSEIDIVLKGYIAGALICAILIVLQKIEYRTVGEFRYTIQVLNNVQIDPNYLSLFLLVGNLFLLLKITKGFQKKRWYIFYGIVFVIITYGIFLTGSRATFIGFLISILFFILDMLINVNRKIRKKLFMVLAVSALVFMIIIRVLPADVYSRLFRMNLHDTSNSLRLSHWRAAIGVIKQRPFFGYGAAHTRDVLLTFGNHNSDAHNTLLTILIHFGFIGTMFFMLILYKIMLGLVKNRKIAELGILLSVCFVCIIISNHLGYSLWVTIIILQNMSLKNKKKTFKEVNV